MALIAISRPGEPVALMQLIFEDTPAPEWVEAHLAKSGFGGSSWRFVERSQIPEDRTYRDAWTDNGSFIEHDMEKARTIHMARIRLARNAKLAETDVLVTRTLEAGQDTKELAAERQSLRDIPQAIDLSKYETVEQLKAVWPLSLGEQIPSPAVKAND